MHWNAYNGKYNNWNPHFPLYGYLYSYSQPSPHQLKVEKHTPIQDASASVAANVTVGGDSAAPVSRDAPVVIAPIAEVSMAEPGQSNNALGGALQAITGIVFWMLCVG